jgi:hypothetical protein
MEDFSYAATYTNTNTNTNTENRTGEHGQKEGINIADKCTL